MNCELKRPEKFSVQFYETLTYSRVYVFINPWENLLRRLESTRLVFQKRMVTWLFSSTSHCNKKNGQSLIHMHGVYF